MHNYEIMIKDKDGNYYFIEVKTNSIIEVKEIADKLLNENNMESYKIKLIY